MPILTDDMRRVIAEQRLDAVIARYGADRDLADYAGRARHVVLVAVSAAAPLVSPAYAAGHTEGELHASWLSYWRSLEDGRRTNET